MVVCIFDVLLVFFFVILFVVLLEVLFVDLFCIFLLDFFSFVFLLVDIVVICSWCFCVLEYDIDENLVSV